MNDQERIIQLEEKVGQYKNTCAEQATTIRAQQTEIERLQHEVSYWQGHVLGLQRLAPMYEDLAFQFRLSPILFYTLTADRRQQIWIEMIRNGWRDLVDKSLPH